MCALFVLTCVFFTRVRHVLILSRSLSVRLLVRNRTAQGSQRPESQELLLHRASALARHCSRETLPLGQDNYIDLIDRTLFVLFLLAFRSLTLLHFESVRGRRTEIQKCRMPMSSSLSTTPRSEFLFCFGRVDIIISGRKRELLSPVRTALRYPVHCQNDNFRSSRKFRGNNEDLK